MQTKTKVTILYGGRSVEHEISVRSAANVAKYIDKNLFDISIIGIDKKGNWFWMKEVSSNFEKGEEIALLLKAESPSFIKLSDGTRQTTDIVLPVLHGTDGEDGSVQGLLKTCNIPMAGTGVTGSAIAMDKILTKQMLKMAGVPVADYLTYSIMEKSDIRFDEVKSKLGLPFMVKASALGSSVGVSKVKVEEDFIPALEDSFKYGDQILIEAYVKGRELECAILGNEDAIASEPGEIIMLKNYDFYDYQAKYQDENAIEMAIPAAIDHKKAEEIKRLSLQAYKVCRCEDFSRIDVFLAEDGQVIINEINTIPGFTSASMFPGLWANKGISYPGLITKIIETAIARKAKYESFATHYDKA
ncbi:MAG: D-alanine--D-alanine ligase [Cyclobacteriaceae bacterium]|nr:D-alanine--D-alanine ligase [Cyclobacteriaceae bacterium]